MGVLHGGNRDCTKDTMMYFSNNKYYANKRKFKHLYPEHKPQWSYSPWEECSVTCGHGTTVRKASCLLGSKIVNVEQCNQVIKEPTSKPCSMTKCEQNQREFSGFQFKKPVFNHRFFDIYPNK